MREFRKRIPGKHAGGIIADGADFHSICWAAEQPEFLLCPEGVISGVQSPLLHFFSAVRAFHKKHVLSKKTLCLFSKRQSVPKHSAVPLSLPPPSREPAPHCPLSRADGITPVTRPRLLASSFSRRLQGDFHAPFLSAFHRHGGSLCRLRCATRPYLRHCIRLPEHHIMFCRFVNCCGEIFPVFPGRSPSHSATSVSTAWRSVWAPPTFPGKIT